MSQLRCCSCRLEPEDGRPLLACSECKFAFHLGACSGVSEEAYKKRGKKTWKCDKCKTGGQKSGTDAEGVSTDSIVAQQLHSLELKIDALLALPSKLQAMETAMQLLSNKFDEFSERLHAQETATKDLSKRVDKLEKSKVDKDVAVMAQDLDKLEYRSRRMNLEIHGIKETEGEDLLAKLNEIAKQISLPSLTRSELETIHRLPAKPGKTRGIIVRFLNQETRDKWLSKRRQLKSENSNTYICENMTRQARELLTMTKEWARKSGFAFVWHANGKVLVRRTNGERAVVIRGSEDITRLS